MSVVSCFSKSVTPISEVVVKTHPSKFMRVGGVALMVFAAPTVGLLCAAASLPGCSSLKKVSDKVYAIVISHPLCYFQYASDRLCATKNIGQRSVIWNGKDVVLANYWLCKMALGKLKLSSTTTEGICWGASVSVIKEVKHVQNEAQLIATVAQFREGFSAEAVALQLVHNVTTEHFNELEMQVDCDSQMKHLFSFLGLSLDGKNDSEEKGFYLVTYADHGVALLNFDFGTYLVEPNWGLFRWDDRIQKNYGHYTVTHSFL